MEIKFNDKQFEKLCKCIDDLTSKVREIKQTYLSKSKTAYDLSPGDRIPEGSDYSGPIKTVCGVGNFVPTHHADPLRYFKS